jgi:hypothetical protein
MAMPERQQVQEVQKEKPAIDAVQLHAETILAAKEATAKIGIVDSVRSFLKKVLNPKKEEVVEDKKSTIPGKKPFGFDKKNSRNRYRRGQKRKPGNYPKNRNGQGQSQNQGQTPKKGPQREMPTREMREIKGSFSDKSQTEQRSSEQRQSGSQNASANLSNNTGNKDIFL